MTRKTTIVVATVVVLAAGLMAVGLATGVSTACDKSSAGVKACKSGTVGASAACNESAGTTSACCKKGAAAAAASAACSKNAAASACSKTVRAGAAKMSGKKACCAKGASASASASRRACCAKSAAAHAAAVKGVVDEIPYRENKRLVVTGEIICGKCTLGKLDKCQPMVKTSNGKIYPLAGGNLVDKLKRAGADRFKISSRVKKLNGVKYLDVTAFHAM